MPEFSHQGDNKKKFVKQIFDDISYKYDFLNRLLSLGIDIYWRKYFIKKLNIKNGNSILDVACGTGDICFEIRKSYNVNIIGIDLSPNMIKIANKKKMKKKYNEIDFINGDAESLPFESNSIDIVTISYGFRNLANYDLALKEFYRVLKPGGLLGILEFSNSKYKFINKIFRIYFHYILPFIGGIFSRSDAYRYLPESVDFFPTRHQICKKIIYSGFKSASVSDLTFGISSIFLGFKSSE